MTPMSRRALLALSAASVPALAFGQAAAPPVLIAPIRVERQRVLVSASLEGHGPYDFLIDSGAEISGVLDTLARELKLRVMRQAPVSAGAGPRDLPLYLADDVTIGGTVRQPRMLLLGLDHVGGGVGLLAAGLLTTLDCDLDFSAGEWRLYPQGRGARPADYVRLVSTLKENSGVEGLSSRIAIEATLDGVAGRFLVDTGAPGQLHLFTHAAVKRGLWDNGRPFAPTAVRSITGRERRPSHLVRGGVLRIGPHRIDGPLVLLEAPGEFDPRTGYDGIIGLDLIQRFDLSIDVAGKAVWARLNSRMPPEQGYNRSGLWLDAGADGRVRVSEVSPGSPGADAGVRVGDLLPAGARIGEMARRFNAPVGTQVPLEVERDGKPMTLTLTLRDFLG